MNDAPQLLDGDDDVWRITIPGLPPDPRRAHWGVVSRAKRQWTELLTYLPAARAVPKVRDTERRGVHVTFYRPGPESDVDNAHSRLKVPLDALKRAGLIVDDAPTWVDVTCATVPSGRTRTVIELRRAV